MSTENGKDELDEPAEGNFQYKFGSIPQTEHIKTRCISLQICGDGVTKYIKRGINSCKIVEEKDLRCCYFAPIISDTQKEPSVKTIPKDLYCNEFLKLNPFCISDLLEFQEEFGIILGARLSRHLLVINKAHHIRPCPDEQAFSGDWRKDHNDQFEGINASGAIFDKLLTEHNAREVIDARKLSVVSFLETISTVLDTQIMIKRTLRVLRDDLPKITTREIIYAAEDTSWLAQLLPKSMPIIQLVKEGVDLNKNVFTLMDAIHLQLARGLVSNAAYRICQNPECERLFTPIEMGRRIDTKYCSSECQERAKRLRYINKNSG